MTRIVCVHGIGQQYEGPNSLERDWVRSLIDGVTLADREPPLVDEVSVAFYGDVFRPEGGKSIGEGDLTAADLHDPDELEWLAVLWAAALSREPALPAPTDAFKMRSPQFAQRALSALSRSAFAVDVAERTLVRFIKQATLYTRDDMVRYRVQEAIRAKITDQTEVIVAHSLGSVVAYEALGSLNNLSVSLVTLGSPLGIPNLIFDRLHPSPVDGIGVFPRAVRTWTNVTDRGDFIAFVNKLDPIFAGHITDVTIHNGAKAHAIGRYLTARETGSAISDGLHHV